MTIWGGKWTFSADLVLLSSLWSIFTKITFVIIFCLPSFQQQKSILNLFQKVFLFLELFVTFQKYISYIICDTFFICDAVFEMWSARIESGARCEIEFYFPVDIKDVTKCLKIPFEENMPLNWHISPVKIMYAIIFHFFAKTWLSKLTHYVRYFVI